LLRRRGDSRCVQVVIVVRVVVIGVNLGTTRIATGLPTRIAIPVV
jgi:hypothetical protein